MIKIFLDRVGKLKKRCEFAKYCFPHGDDDRFVNSVMQIGKEPALVSLEKIADVQENDKTIRYHIYMEESRSGFFADHNRLLEYLYFADYFGLKPVVEYTERYCYAEKHPVNGTTNPFEYYFVQPGGESLGEMGKAGTVVRSKKENTLLAKAFCQKKEGYTRSEEYLAQMGRITATYIKLQPAVECYIETEKRQLLNKETVLGVHVRGTDFKRNYNGHPVSVTVQEYLEQACQMMETYKYDQIFLATDDENAIQIFGEQFGNKLVYYSDVVRGTGNETVMKSISDRENHHYKLGLEVLRDMHTLADCDGLLAGLSQVSYAARIQKLSYGKQYAEMRILDKGINYHRAESYKG